MQLGSPRKIQLFMKYFLFGTVCFVLYMTLFDLITLKKVSTRASPIVLVVNGDDKVDVVVLGEKVENKDGGDAIDKNRHDTEVEADDKVTITVVDQHQEGIFSLFQ